MFNGTTELGIEKAKEKKREKETEAVREKVSFTSRASILCVQSEFINVIATINSFLQVNRESTLDNHSFTTYFRNA